MKETKEIINIINEIKKNVEICNYSNKDELTKDFYSIRNNLWKNIHHIKEADLSNLSTIHNFLINEVCKIHNLEKDKHNEEAYRSNIDISKIKDKLNDGKRACEIYSFNDDSYTYYFIGDLHSDTISLKSILEKCNFFQSIVKGEKIRLIFLGDYVDRGTAHLEIIEFILLLKYIFPQSIYLLRGNHDGGSYENNELKLCVGRNKNTTDNDYFILYAHNLSKTNNSFKSETVYNYLTFFSSLCNLALFNFENLNILGVHGGIPRPVLTSEKYYSYINSISDLTREDLMDSNNRSIKHNMLWSDPCETFEESFLNSGRFKFGKDIFMQFMETIGLDLVLRGHQAEKEGIKNFFDNRLFTLFSSGIVLNSENENINTETAYKEIHPKILKVMAGKDVHLIDLSANGITRKIR